MLMLMLMLLIIIIIIIEVLLLTMHGYVYCQCPVVFGISDNGTAISLKGYGWLDKFVERYDMQKFFANGQDMIDVHAKSAEAFEYTRSTGRPSILVFQGIVRRFGHAATDRQFAYLSKEEIDSCASTDPVAGDADG